MKIVIATPLYPPDIGGPATYAEILHTELPKRGVEIELVKFSEVRHLPKLVRHVAYYRRILKAARNADIIVALDPVSVGFPAMKAAKKLGKKFIVKIVGDYAWEQGRQRFGVKEDLDAFVKTQQSSWTIRFFQRLQTRVAKGASLIIVPSEYLKGIVSTWGIQADKIRVIYNAVPLDAAGTVPSSVQALPHPLVVSVGRLVPWKHFDALIDAVAHTSGISLAIVGDGPERDRLERHAHEVLPGTVFTGALSHADTLATMKSADVFVLNSSYEGFSHLLIESLSLGVATIATDVGGNSEIISHEQSGLLVPAGDTAQLANALARVVSEEGLRKELVAQGKESVQRFSVDTMVTAVYDLCTSL